MKILFQNNHLDLRGTGNQNFSYAHFNETILNNESIVCCIKDSPYTDSTAKEMFEKYFKVIYYDGSQKELDNIILNEKVDILYSLKGGARDNNISHHVPTCVHGVFDIDLHGNKHAVISNWLAEDVYKKKKITVPVVPHLINLPNIENDLRDFLNIPKDAFVVGRLGGMEQFDVPFVWNSIKTSLEKRNDIYFVLMNTPIVLKHERIFYIKGTANLVKKRRFINTCDIHLHARTLGESFGLTVGEFSYCNKPVLTYFNSPQKAHIEYLGNVGFYYRNEQELTQLLLNDYDKNKNYDVYSERFSPLNVMNQFKKVFLD